MRVLGIAASPRRGGNTDRLLAEVLKGAQSAGASVTTIVLSKLSITPCQHCDDCLAAGVCSINDDMQMVYRELEAADRVVIASPVQFMGPTTELKAMIDRCQAMWARKYVLKLPPLGDRRERKGLFVSVGGRQAADTFEPSLAIVKTFFRVLDIGYAGALLFSGIDKKDAIAGCPEAIHQAFQAGERLVSGT